MRMQAAGFASIVVGCGVVFAAALLLNAGAGKFMSSTLAEVALRDTLGLPHSAVVRIAVRGLAIAEILTSIGLVIDGMRTIAIVIASLLGFSFAVFGVVARLRGVTVACGCLGSIDKRPIGLRSTALGAVLALLFPLSIIAPLRLPTTLAAGYVSIAALILGVYLNRRFAVEPLLRRPVLGPGMNG